MSLTQVDREVFDYQRFPNARSVGCFGGSVPVSIPPGNPSKQRLGSITKVGNPRIRVLLVEMAWRLVKFQRQYQPIQKWH
jgi:transposase